MSATMRVDGGTIVTPSGRLRAALAIEDGRIAAIGEESNLPKAVSTIDASGKHILPGLVDPHVHFRYVDTPIDESFGLMTRSAAAGGVTTVIPFIASLESREFTRIRVGIAPEQETEGLRRPDFVLGDFSSEEKDLIKVVQARVADAIYSILTDGIKTAMNKFN